MAQLKGCPSCLRYVALFFNCILTIIGLTILAVAIWIHYDFGQYAKAHPDLERVHSTIVLIAVGAVITIVGFIGYCGASRESQCLLVTYFAVVLVIFAAGVAVAIWTQSNKDALKDTIANAVQDTIKYRYGQDPVQTGAIDFMQQTLQCCGASSQSDWANTLYNGMSPEKTGIAGAANTLLSSIAAVGQAYRVPESCCLPNVDYDTCKKITEKVPAVVSNLASVGGSPLIANEGCTEKLFKHFGNNMSLIMAAAIGAAVLMILGMVLSLVLCCAIRRASSYIM